MSKGILEECLSSTLFKIKCALQEWMLIPTSTHLFADDAADTTEAYYVSRKLEELDGSKFWWYLIEYLVVQVN